MNREVADLWARATQAQSTALALCQSDPDAAASRAYYAAFYAVSAYFAFGGRTFSKHSAIEAAVHRDLVKAGKWSPQVGAAFSALAERRMMADYGGGRRVTPDDARQAAQDASQILDAVRGISSEPLP